MKICVKESGSKGFSITLPNWMILRPKLIRFGLRAGRHYAGDSVPDIPQETIKALCCEIKAIKKKYGTWTLVDVQSSSGDLVQITL